MSAEPMKRIGDRFFYGDDVDRTARDHLREAARLHSMARDALVPLLAELPAKYGPDVKIVEKMLRGASDQQKNAETKIRVVYEEADRYLGGHEPK